MIIMKQKHQIMGLVHLFLLRAIKNKSNMNDERLKQLKSILEMLQIQRCNIFLRPSSKTAQPSKTIIFSCPSYFFYQNLWQQVSCLQLEHFVCHQAVRSKFICIRLQTFPHLSKTCCHFEEEQINCVNEQQGVLQSLKMC